MASMYGKQKQQPRWTAWVVLALLLAVFSYPFSVGPVGMYVVKSGDDDVLEYFTKFYEPLRLLPPPLLKTISWWEELWER